MIKTALNSSFCAETADSKSRWPHGEKAYLRGIALQWPASWNYFQSAPKPFTDLNYSNMIVPPLCNIGKMRHWEGCKLSYRRYRTKRTLSRGGVSTSFGVDCSFMHSNLKQKYIYAPLTEICIEQLAMFPAVSVAVNRTGVCPMGKSPGRSGLDVTWTEAPGSPAASELSETLGGLSVTCAVFLPGSVSTLIW